MLKQLFSHDWLPSAVRRDFPLTRFYLRKPPPVHFRQIVFGSSLGLFLLFGGLSLPMLYFMVSLIILLQLATGTTHKIHQAQRDGIWDLVGLTSLPRRDILWSTWAAGIWQIRQTRLMLLYRMSHGMLLIGTLVFALTFGDIPSDKGLVIVIGVTLLIALQPYADMYLSGMVGSWCAAAIADRLVALAVSGGIMIFYWLLWIGGALFVAFYGLKTLSNFQLSVIFMLPLVLPSIIGYLAQGRAERVSTA